MLVAPTIDTSGSLYIYLQQINATFFGPMLAVILCGMMTTFVNARAAKISLLVGPALFYLLNFVFGDAYQAFMMKLFGLSEPLHFLHTLAVVFVVTLVILFAFSRGQRDEYAAAVMPASNVEINLEPWRFARIAGALISVTTLVCYIALAQ
jgi:SSS family solute:Na+ symporter